MTDYKFEIIDSKKDILLNKFLVSWLMSKDFKKELNAKVHAIADAFGGKHAMHPVIENIRWDDVASSYSKGNVSEEEIFKNIRFEIEKKIQDFIAEHLSSATATNVSNLFGDIYVKDVQGMNILVEVKSFSKDSMPTPRGSNSAQQFLNAMFNADKVSSIVDFNKYLSTVLDYYSTETKAHENVNYRDFWQTVMVYVPLTKTKEDDKNFRIDVRFDSIVVGSMFEDIHSITRGNRVMMTHPKRNDSISDYEPQLIMWSNVALLGDSIRTEYFKGKKELGMKVKNDNNASSASDTSTNTIKESAPTGIAGGSKFPYFSYEILSLNHSLDQKGNTRMPGKFHLVVGDKVEGICAYDKKIHHGTIQRFFVKEGETKPSLIYILDKESMIVPLYASTVKKKFHRESGVVQVNKIMPGNTPSLY